MTISIDCRHLDSSGIGVYLRECLAFFFETEHRFLLIGDEKKLARLSAGRPNVEIARCTVKPFSLKELFAFPRGLLRRINRTDRYYSPSFNVPGGITIPVFTTIHDIIFCDFPGLVTPAGKLARVHFYRRAARRSRLIFTVSEFSKSRIKHHLGDVPVAVTYSAPSAYLMEAAEGAAEHAPESEKSVLFIGNIKKHKGLRVLLDAFREARAAGLLHRLIVVGSGASLRSRDRQTIERLETDGAVEWREALSNEETRALLDGAALLVQPSFYEGFGLPPLEAMIRGTAALISDIAVFKEIYAGFPVVFFKTGDAADLRDKMLEILYNKEKRPVKLDAGQRGRYSFAKTAGIVIGELCRTQ
jgi:glycosyltransferase involved in cell wall biosynthesis